MDCIKNSHLIAQEGVEAPVLRALLDSGMELQVGVSNMEMESFIARGVGFFFKQK